MIQRAFWRGKKVFLTGHTGFKGGWLATWLLDMGCEVHGLALPPDTEPSFFALCGLGERMRSHFGDVRDSRVVAEALADSQAEIVIHLAAQPLVLRSYREPVETLATNVLGTAHVLEAVRRTPSVRVAVVVTSDKSYANQDWLWPYRESDPVGGDDPYSASKSCAELVTAAYRRSFLSERGVGVASVRAGNVIGGGDWGEDRIVPDAMRALHRGEPLLVRNPTYVRPWQHVLEPLCGYLMLAERLQLERERFEGGWNFGPSEEDQVTVGRLADLVVGSWGAGRWESPPRQGDPHEAQSLRLDCAKARALLGWRPRLRIQRAVEMTVEWYREALSGRADMFERAREQIRTYEAG